MTFWVRFLEILGNFNHEPDLYMTSFHHIFTTFHYIFTTNLHYRGMNRQGQTDSMWTHRQIFTTNLHYEFSPRIFTTDLTLMRVWFRGQTAKISLETVVSFNILIHSSGNSVKKGCTDKFLPHVVKINKFTPHVVKILSCKSISFHHIMLISW